MSNPIKAGNDKMVDEYKAYQSDCEKILSSHYLRSVEFLNTRIFAGGNFFDAQRLLKGTTEDVVTKARLICMAGIPRYEGENIKNEYYNFWCNFIESWENALILRETVSGWFSTKLDQQRDEQQYNNLLSSHNKHLHWQIKMNEALISQSTEKI